MPVRVQRKRVKGWEMPQGCRYVGRPTRHGNPYMVVHIDNNGSWGYEVRDRRTHILVSHTQRHQAQALEIALALYECHVKDMIAHDPFWLKDLEGLDLMCWCGLSQPCHADILLARANGLPLPDRGEWWFDQLLPFMQEKYREIVKGK